MRLLRRIGANARYFTDASSKIALDIESGEAAAGMTIDFYGRYQSESVRRPDGTSRLGYVTPPGGSSYGADPIALLRGAPNPEVAREFLRFCLLPEGQRLWGWKAGREGGPLRYALRRLPMLPDLYDDRFAPDRADPEVQPYREAAKFRYVESRTGKLFSAFAFVFRVMCIDTHDELRAAWGALIESGFPPDAAALFDDIAPVTYAEASGTIAKAVGSNADKIAQVRLAKQLSDRFRDQYSRVESLCRAAKR
jgi:ABC-type glycerol-3-phosphate transport system substrate-binding protein